MPRISVIITAFDIESLIGECLESVLKQTLQDLEVIVVDDCSRDGTVQVAESFAARDARVRVIQHDRNRGPGGGRNTGLDVAQGDFIAFVDGDDWLREDMLERASTACLEADVPVCLFTFTYFWPTEQRFDYEVGDYDLPRQFESGPDTILRMPVTLWSKLYDRRTLIDSGIRFAERMAHDDSQFFFSFFAKVEPDVVRIDEHLYVYRGRPDSLMGEHERTRPQVPDMVEGVWKYYQEHDLVQRYGPVMCRLLNEHYQATMPGLDPEAQQPFYDGLKPTVLELAAAGLQEHFSRELTDVADHDYVRYLQLRNAELKKIGRDRWYRFGQLTPRRRVRAAGRAALARLGLDKSVDRLLGSLRGA